MWNLHLSIARNWYHGCQSSFEHSRRSNSFQFHNENFLSCLLIFVQSLTPQTISLPAEIPHPTIYTSLISQSAFHSTTNTLHHRLLCSPYPSPRELLALNQTIDVWERSIPAYFQLDSPTIQTNEAFLFARHRLSWRCENMRIILFVQSCCNGHLNGGSQK